MQDFCIFTLGHEAPEPPLASIFNHVFAHPISCQPYPEMLLIFHRHGLADNIEFTMAKLEHASDIHDLTDGKLNSETVNEGEHIMVAECEGTVVGAVKLITNVDLQGLKAEFNIRKILGDFDHHSHNFLKVAKAENLTMNPIFSHRYEYILKYASSTHQNSSSNHAILSICVSLQLPFEFLRGSCSCVHCCSECMALDTVGAESFLQLQCHLWM